MDIEYLLILQNFRDNLVPFLAPSMDWVTKMAVSYWPITMLLMIYWVADRKSGRRMLAGLSLGYLMNGFLKLTVCAYRPWIRDVRIEPYGDSKVAATGYSFPSGHTTVATMTYGSVGFWFRNRKRIISIIMGIMILLTMFSRNFLGVHTPQDVVVGFVATVVMLWLGYVIEEWSDKDPDKRDKIIIVAGLIICVILVAYYYLKPYPMDHLSDGSLLVDPKQMIPDSFEGIGAVVAFSICRYFERRGFEFEAELNWKDRFIVGAFALFPLMWWCSHIVNIFAAMDLKFIGRFLYTSGIIVYAMIIVPFVMKKVKELRILEKN